MTHAALKGPLVRAFLGRRFAAIFFAGCAAAAVAGVLVAHHEDAQALNETSERFVNLSHLIPSYPDAHFFPMGESLGVSGLWREMGYAITPDRPRKVADRYEAIWTSQGFAVDHHSADEGEWVSASALGEPWVRAILATRDGDKTIIVASVHNLARPLESPPMPVSPLCDIVSDDGAKDHGVQTAQVLMSCKTHLDEIVDYYDGALQGATRSERFGADGSCHDAYITYSERDREVSLIAKESDPDPDGTPRTAVSITWQERR